MRFLGGDDSVVRNELGEDTAGDLDTEGQGADVNQNDIFNTFPTREDTTLNDGTIGDSLVRVDTLSKVLLDELLDLGNTSQTTDEDDLEAR